MDYSPTTELSDEISTIRNTISKRSKTHNRSKDVDINEVPNKKRKLIGHDSPLEIHGQEAPKGVVDKDSPPPCTLEMESETNSLKKRNSRQTHTPTYRIGSYTFHDTSEHW